VATSASLATAPAEAKRALNFLLADLYIRNKQFPEARTILEASLSENPKGKDETLSHLESVSRLARTHLAENNVAGAVGVYQAYLDRHPESELEMELRKNLGRLQRQQGQEEAALAQFERTEVLARERLEKTDTPDEKSLIMMVIADALELRNDPDGSRAMYRKIIDDFPMGRYRPLAMAQLAQSFEKNGDLESAKAQYSQIIEMYPNTPPARAAMEQLQRMKSFTARDQATTATLGASPAVAPVAPPAADAAPAAAEAPADAAEKN
jgi:tetratricopeptide (TPR) repeat protein